MKKTIVAGLFLVAVSLTGCSAKGESEMKDSIAAMNEFCDALEAKDIAKIEAASKKMQEIMKKVEELKLTAEEKKKLEEKYSAELEKVKKRMGSAFMGGGMPGMPNLSGGMPGMPNLGGGMPNMPNIPSPDASKKK